MQKPRLLSVLVSLAACGMVAALGALLGPAAPSASAAATDLFISEYVEGSSTNKALELFNGTAGPIVLDGTYDIQIHANGSATATATILLVGTVAANDAFVLARGGSASELVARADQTTGNFLFNGNDAVVLRRGGVALDVIGEIGADPGAAWTGSGVSTLDATMQRRAHVMSGDADGSDSFDPSLEWDGVAIDTFTGLGSHAIDGAPLNRPPHAVADEAQADHSPVRIEVLANDSDPDGDALTIVALDDPPAGAAAISDDGAAVVYTPPAGTWDTAVFGYTVRDPAGATSSAEIEVVFAGDPGPEPEPETDCDATPTIEGTDGADLLFGTVGPDLIHAGAGDDIVFGLGGDDIICGGAGIDVLFGGAGADILIDESGRTWALGGMGDDVIRTGDARDHLLGGPGADSLDGGPGPDVLYGGGGSDVCATDPADHAVGCTQGP